MILSAFSNLYNKAIVKVKSLGGIYRATNIMPYGLYSRKTNQKGLMLRIGTQNAFMAISDDREVGDDEVILYNEKSKLSLNGGVATLRVDKFVIEVNGSVVEFDGKSIKHDGIEIGNKHKHLGNMSSPTSPPMP